MKKTLIYIWFIIFVLLQIVYAAESTNYAVQVSVEVQENPPQLIPCHEFSMPSIGGFSAFLKP